MRVLRYMSLRFLALAIVATLVLASIAEVLDLVDNAGDILDRGQGAAGFGTYLLLRVPTLISHAIPLGALVGALMTLGLFARGSEIVAMRASGRSSWNLFAMMFPAAFVIAGLHCVLLDAVLPKTEQRLALWWAEGPDPKIDGSKPVWLRVGADVVSFEGIANRGRTLKNLKVFERAADKTATGRLTATEARWEKKRWMLTGGTYASFKRGASNAATPADGEWKTTFTPADAVAAMEPFGQISAAAAQAVLTGHRVANAPLSFYETQFHRVFAAPMAAVVMLLLAMPAAFVNWRDARSAKHAMSGLALGLIFLVCDGLLTSLGLAGILPPVVAAWAGTALFLGIGALNLNRMELGLARPSRRRTLALETGR